MTREDIGRIVLLKHRRRLGVVIEVIGGCNGGVYVSSIIHYPDCPYWIFTCFYPFSDVSLVE